MKKYYLIALAIIVLLLGGIYIRLFATQISFNESIENETGVFVLDNMNNANIKIVTAKTDKITVDLKGAKGSTDKIRFFKTSGSIPGFSLPEEWQELSGTITVPEGTLLDIRLSNNSDLTIGDQSADDVSNFLVDTSGGSEINIENNGGNIIIDDWGGNIVWDTDSWEEFFNGGEGGGEGEEGPPECSIGSQSIRNYCCERQNQYEPVPECSTYGHWVFNNSSRECEYLCENQPEEEEPAIDCSIGSQEVRNTCCSQLNVGVQTPECIGEWQFNNVTRSCEFHCYTEEELEDYFGGSDGSDPEPVTRFCEDFNTQEEKDECCDYNLRNELSIGPRPGFPDCIGKWYFDEEDGCSFRCADYHEMQEILKELKKRAQEQEE
jgi:hypothetical protein